MEDVSAILFSRLHLKKKNCPDYFQLFLGMLINHHEWLIFKFLKGEGGAVQGLSFVRVCVYVCVFQYCTLTTHH